MAAGLNAQADVMDCDRVSVHVYVREGGREGGREREGERE
jgi:hypothetical protein